MNAVVDSILLSADQQADLATLLERTSTNRNLGWLSTTLTGVDVLQESANQIGDTKALARALVKLLVDKGAVGDAIALLQREFPNNLYLLAGLGAILNKERLDNDNLQALLNRYEPFFNSADFQQMLPRVRSTVCAVAAGRKLLGTGFLVGPAHVLTNFHVLRPYLKPAANGTDYEQNAEGKDICCVFDYRAEPPPRLDDAATEDSRVVIVRAADQWLVHARKQLPDDGTAKAPPKVDTEYDYVLIELSRPIGQKPARVGGGALRGWLTLPTKCDFFGKRKIVLFQHPGGAAQHFDIGDFSQLDPTATRVWYSVSSAHGSSGGAAVGTNGELIALHNAQVDSPPGPPGGVNQGVRIDLIAEDLRNTTRKWNPPLPPDQHPLAFWSLNDSLASPRPIIGRQAFREAVVRMMNPEAERVLTVIGEFGTFVGFSLSLLQRTLGNLVPIARFTPENMGVMTPPEFLDAILDQLGVERDPADPMPMSPPPTETAERWHAIYLPKWLARQLARHEKKRPGVFPAWVAIDVTTPRNAAPLWAKGLRDLVTAMFGARDAGQTVDVPQLRWLLMSTVRLPLGTVRYVEEDLLADPRYVEDFATCMTIAWKTIDKEVENAQSVFATIAEITLEESDGLPRKILAQKAARMVKTARGK
ncbi:MAG TPA: serine protease [Steroidobacteraceae bacterium]|nr:serine protease [Steroidobacteraceae bacterium]